jgi:excisionase family DNA binding protein
MLALLTTSEAAHLLKISTLAINNLRTSGQLKAIRLGGRFKFTHEDLEAFVEGLRKGRSGDSGGVASKAPAPKASTGTPAKSG